MRRYREEHSKHIAEVPQRRVKSEWEVLQDGKIVTLRSYEPEVVKNSIPWEKLDQVFDGFKWAPRNLDAREGGSELLMDADKQIGKAMEMGGGTKETLARCKQSVSNAITRYSVARPDELFFIDGGDGIENIFNTDKQISTNDLELDKQILAATRWAMEAIKTLLPFTERLVYGMVPSNHGEVRTGPKTAPFSTESDWGYLIFEHVKDRCEDAGLPVEFVRPDFLQETLTFTTIDGTKVAINHGHQSASGKIDVIKTWIKGQDHGRMPGWDADVWVMNHFHHPYFDTIGNGRALLGTPSNDPGSLWVSKKTGDSSKPGMLAVTLENGFWENYSLL